MPVRNQENAVIDLLFLRLNIVFLDLARALLSLISIIVFLTAVYVDYGPEDYHSVITGLLKDLSPSSYLPDTNEEIDYEREFSAFCEKYHSVSQQRSHIPTSTRLYNYQRNMIEWSKNYEENLFERNMLLGETMFADWTRAEMENTLMTVPEYVQEFLQLKTHTTLDENKVFVASSKQFDADFIAEGGFHDRYAMYTPIDIQGAMRYLNGRRRPLVAFWRTPSAYFAYQNGTLSPTQEECANGTLSMAIIHAKGEIYKGKDVLYVRSTGPGFIHEVKHHQVMTTWGTCGLGRIGMVYPFASPIVDAILNNIQLQRHTPSTHV